MHSPTFGPYQFDAVHGPEVGGETILDLSTFGALQELAGDDDPDLVNDLVQLFLGDSAGRMEEIEEAQKNEEVDSVGRAAHALKSSSANIGALPFSRTCAELERLVRCEEVDMDELDALIARALTMYTEVKDALGQDA